MNKMEFAVIGILMTTITLVTGIITDNVSGLRSDQQDHKNQPCHTSTCLQIEQLTELINEEHCINVAQIKGEDPLNCI